MTNWGMLLLAAYVGFGLSGLEIRRASAWALATTVVVLLAVGLKHGAV